MDSAPRTFPNGLSDILQYSTDKKRTVLGDFYCRQASPMEVEQEYYFLFADHGSDYHGMYQSVDGQPADTAAGSPPHLCPDY